MNSNSKIENTEITIGQRLLQAREKLGLSQEEIAELLCLKLCTISEIENDSNINGISTTFLRGYIRSYAKLVKVPEKEIIELLDKQIPIKDAMVSPIQNYSLGRMHKKQEYLLVNFAWIIIIMCIIMAGIWWWQEYKARKEEIITTMIIQNSIDKFLT